ncbi:hypothetical protein [Methanosarcina sp.]|uniref:hypothetical protein n=1 Tax=Methanosarcina sp. TaxID=2213 RepID=UPI002AB84A62|nr:hypothetical protein [Methanosarcina sp.]MDY9924744.1 hypothetical protein [Methanosarcina sp.]
MCNGCYATLADTNRILREDDETKAGVNEKLSEIGKGFTGNIEVRHIVEYLVREVSPEKSGT